MTEEPLNRDEVPEVLPGTTEGVKREMLASPAEMLELRRQANRLKNQGVMYPMPASILPGVNLRLRPISHGALSAAEAEDHAEMDRLLRRRTGKKVVDLPYEVRLEITRRKVIRTLRGAEGKVDVEGVRAAIRAKNRGIKFQLPPDVLGGAILRMRSIAHPAITMARVHYEEELRSRLFLGPKEPLPPAASVELDRFGIERCLVGWVSDDVFGRELKLQGKSSQELRAFFRQHFFPQPDLRARPPEDPQERDEFWGEVFADVDHHLLDLLLRGQEQMRDVTSATLVAKGDNLVLGANWDDTQEEKAVASEPEDWSNLSAYALQQRFAEAFLPPIDVRRPIPDEDGPERESILVEMFEGFGNDILNELLEAHDRITHEDPAEVLAHGPGYMLGPDARRG